MTHSLFFKLIFLDEFPFDLVFLIPLRNVTDNCFLEDVIMDQHDQLKETDKPMIKLLLEGRSNKSVLLLLDGYDEYNTRINPHIDKAIESGIGKMFLILTSCPGTASGDRMYISQKIKKRMHGLVAIEGFNEESKRRFCSMYFGNKEEGDKLLIEAQNKLGKGRYEELLSTPIILLMICVLYDEQKSLPDKMTKIFETVRELVMDRTTLNSFKCKSKEVKDLDKKLYVLAKFAWEALLRKSQELLINKVNCISLYMSS